MWNDCARCGRFRRIKARGLCPSCYQYHRIQGTIESYPVASRTPVTRSEWCTHAYPLVEALKWFSAYQCAQCGFPIHPSRYDELGISHDQSA